MSEESEDLLPNNVQDDFYDRMFQLIQESLGVPQQEIPKWFLEIAVATIPEGWRIDKHNDKYYFFQNEKWSKKHPARLTLSLALQIFISNKIKVKPTIARKLVEVHKKSKMLENKWGKAVNKKGQTVFVNRETKEQSFEDPRVARAKKLIETLVNKLKQKEQKNIEVSEDNSMIKRKKDEKSFQEENSGQFDRSEDIEISQINQPWNNKQENDPSANLNAQVNKSKNEHINVIDKVRSMRNQNPQKSLPVSLGSKLQNTQVKITPKVEDSFETPMKSIRQNNQDLKDFEQQLAPNTKAQPKIALQGTGFNVQNNFYQPAYSAKIANSSIKYKKVQKSSNAEVQPKDTILKDIKSMSHQSPNKSIDFQQQKSNDLNQSRQNISRNEIRSRNTKLSAIANTNIMQKI